MIFAVFLQSVSTLFFSNFVICSQFSEQKPVENIIKPDQPRVSQVLGFAEWKENQELKAEAAIKLFIENKREKISSLVDSSNENVENSVDERGNLNEIGDEISKPSEKNSKNPELIENDATQKNQEMAVSDYPEMKLSDADQAQLKQLEFNLSLAQDLSVHDYFALYLKDKSRDEFQSVVQKLSPEELGELLLAYRSNLYGNSGK